MTGPLSGPVFRLSYVLVGGALIAVPIAACSASIPTLTSPFPAPFLLAFWVAGPFGLIAAAMLPVAFWLLFPELARGETSIHTRALVLLGIIWGLSAIWTVNGFEYAEKYQGTSYASTIALLNTLVPVALLLGWYINRIRPAWWLAFAFHWFLFAWAGSYSFAYMGELP